MRRLTTILCSIAFMVCGISLAITTKSPPISDYKALNAATMSNMPVLDYSNVQLPLDMQLDQAKKDTDTVYITKTDTVKIPVTKVKRKKVYVPNPIVKRDTIYYIATHTVNKEDTVKHIYKLNRVDKEAFKQSIPLMGLVT